MAREDLSLSAFTWTGAIWIGLAVLIYAVGDLAARVSLPKTKPYRIGLDASSAAILTFYLNTLFLAVTLLWVGSAAYKAGGVTDLINLAYLDSLTARDILLETKLFTGMRLFYAALPATGCFAAALLASGPDRLTRRAKHFCWAVLLLNTIALLLLPLVMSQRLILLQFLLSCYLVSCLIRRRFVGLPWLGLGMVLFLTTWVMREALTNPQFEQSAIDIGLQKLAFYFVNDLWNAFAPLQAQIDHTFGAVSLRGIMFLTLTDGVFSDVTAERLQALDAVLGGGDFPFFTAAYVDFGAFGGALFICACAFFFRIVFHKAQHNLSWSVIYAQLGAALLFSSHGVYFTHQNFLFSLAVIGLISWFSSTRSHEMPRAPATMNPFQDARQDAPA